MYFRCRSVTLPPARNIRPGGGSGRHRTPVAQDVRGPRGGMLHGITISVTTRIMIHIITVLHFYFHGKHYQKTRSVNTILLCQNIAIFML